MKDNWKEIIQKQNAVLSKLTKRNYSDIGNYEISICEIQEISNVCRISVQAMEKFFLKLDETRYLSKSGIYYNFLSMFQERQCFYDILSRVRHLFVKQNKGYWILVALYEYYINFLATFMYAVFSCCHDGENEKQFKCLKKLYMNSCDTVYEYLSLIYEDKVIYKNIEDTNIQSTIRLIEKSKGDFSPFYMLNYRVFREYDNKLKCCNELICVHYLLDVENIHVNNFAFPLYGSIMLAIFTKPIIKFWGFNEKVNVLPLHIGFHDLKKLNLRNNNFESDKKKILPKYISEEILNNIKNSTTLVIDDNLGNGTTLSYCKKFIEHFDGLCITRTAETTWNKYISGEKIINVDYPAIEDYLKYTQQYDYIQLLNCSGKYVRDLEYNSQKITIGRSEISRLVLNESQKRSLLLEYDFKKKIYNLHDKY